MSVTLERALGEVGVSVVGASEPLERGLNGRLASEPAGSRARPCVTVRRSLSVT
jgi:hypothetical protein